MAKDNIIIDLIISTIKTVQPFAEIIGEAHELGLIRRKEKYDSYIESAYFGSINHLEKYFDYINFCDLLFDTARTEKACVLDALEELKKKGQP